MDTKKTIKLSILIASVTILVIFISCGVNGKRNTIDTAVTNDRTNEDNEKNDSTETIMTTDRSEEDDKEGTSAVIEENKSFKDISSCNSAYKMFYGEWEVVEVRDLELIMIVDEEENLIESHQPVNYVKDPSTGNILRGMGERVDGVMEYTYSEFNSARYSEVANSIANMVGNKMIFMPEYIKCNEAYVTTKPIYTTYIHPTSKYMRNVYQENMQWDELSYKSPKEPYYVCVSVDFQLQRNQDVEGACTDFMLIDDDTMLGDIIGRKVKLKRISHIENVEDKYIYNPDEQIEDIAINLNEKPNYNMGYKMFYGKWKANKILASPEIIDKDSDIAVKELLGDELNILRDEIQINGKLITGHPMYRISIIPLVSDNQIYIKGLPSIAELGIKAKYFIFVEVESMYAHEDYKAPLNKFYIKDDETLIAEERGYYLELKRSEYIEDVEVVMELP